MLFASLGKVRRKWWASAGSVLADQNWSFRLNCKERGAPIA
jgi:hypothetical protein